MQKSIYYSMLRAVMAEHMRKDRKDLGMTQSQMAEKLELDLRSYSNVENDKSLCSTVTMMLYLLYICPDANELMKEIRGEMDILRKLRDEAQKEEQKRLEEEAKALEQEKAETTEI